MATELTRYSSPSHATSKAYLSDWRRARPKKTTDHTSDRANSIRPGYLSDTRSSASKATPRKVERRDLVPSDRPPSHPRCNGNNVQMQQFPRRPRVVGTTDAKTIHNPQTGIGQSAPAGRGQNSLKRLMIPFAAWQNDEFPTHDEYGQQEVFSWAHVPSRPLPPIDESQMSSSPTLVSQGQSRPYPCSSDRLSLVKEELEDNNGVDGNGLSASNDRDPSPKSVLSDPDMSMSYLDVLVSLYTPHDNSSGNPTAQGSLRIRAPKQEYAALQKRLDEECEKELEKERDAALQAHCEQIDRNTQLVDSWAKDFKEKQDQTDELEHQLQEKQDQMEELEHQLQKKQDQMDELKHQLQEKQDQMDNQQAAQAQRLQDVVSQSVHKEHILRRQQQQLQRRNDDLKRHIHSLRRQALAHRGHQGTLARNTRVLESRHHQLRRYAAQLQAQYQVLRRRFWAKAVVAQRDREKATQSKRCADEDETRAQTLRRRNRLPESMIRRSDAPLRTDIQHQDGQNHGEQVLLGPGHQLPYHFYNPSPHLFQLIIIIIYIRIHTQNAEAQDRRPRLLPRLLPAPTVESEVQSIATGASSSVNDIYPPPPPAPSLSQSRGTGRRRRRRHRHRDKQGAILEMVRKAEGYASLRVGGRYITLNPPGRLIGVLLSIFGVRARSRPRKKSRS